MTDESQIETKPRLEKGKEYKLELYPSNKKVKAKYLGYSKREYNGKGFIDDNVFVFDDTGKRTYAFVDNHWMIEEEGIITYTSVSSAPIRRATEKYLKEEFPNMGTTKEALEGNKREASRLLKILRDLGEDI